MLFSISSSSREPPTANVLSSLSQKILTYREPKGPSESGAMSGFDEKGNYVIRAVLKGSET